MTLARRISRPLGAACTTIAVAAVAASGMALAPAATQAGPAQQAPPNAHGDLGPAGGASIDVEVFKGQETDVVAALDELDDNVHRQLAEVERARAGLASAKAGLERADAALAATQARIHDLVALSDEVVVDAFINPPSDDAIDALTGDSVADASVKASIVDLQTDADASVLEELHAAQSELKARKGEQDEAAATADAKADAAAAALTDLESAQSQQAAFVLEVQDRLDRTLSEAEALAKIDPALAAQLEAEQFAIAARLEAIRRDDAQRGVLVALQTEQAEAAARQAAEAQAAAQAAAAAQPGGMGPASGSLATVACPGGGSITVDSSLASNLSQLLDAVSAAGLDVCGGGYRDPAEQIALRQAHCGTSYYAIYQAPSSSCSPPTARPGTSMHEQGLAIDFTCGGSTVSIGGACFSWLTSHAAAYGLYNLPSEPWHWSTDGT